MAQYTITTPPAGGVLSLVTFKEFLGLDALDTSQDTILSLILSSVQSTFERYTGVVLQETVFEMISEPRVIQNILTIAKSPVTAISSVEIYNGTAYEAVTEFDTKLGYNAHVHILSTQLYGKTHEKYKVAFTAGLSSIPSDVVLAMYQHGAFAFENRGDCSLNACGFPSFIIDIYDSYKVIWI